MADPKFEPEELKKLIKLGKQRELSFAYCPGGVDGDVFLVHRRKAPDMLGKKARKEADRPKAAYGTFRVEGRVITMTCLALVPALDKRIRKFLRENRVSMQVALLDAAGKEISG